MEKLKQSDAVILKLLRRDPFAGKAPKHVRALLYRYSFTSPEQKSETGNYWRRELIREIGSSLENRI
jgi:hypothetical protein